jgi:Ca-activated chloride channel family protein
MHPEPLPATVINRARGRAFLSELHAHGKTDVFTSLRMLLDLTGKPGRPVLAMLVTDGVPTQGVVDTREILERFTRRNGGEVSVFSMGGGERVNRLLLDFLSYRNRGRALVTRAKNGLPVAIEQMAREVARPVLADLRYQFTRGGSVRVYPRQLSHLYLDSPLVLVGRVPADQPRIGFQMIGRSAGGEHDLVFDVDLASAPRGAASLRREWAWQALLEELSGIGTRDEAERLARVRELIDTYDLEVPPVYREPFPAAAP